MQTGKKPHWDNIYQTKEPHQVSWTQKTPATSLELIKACKLSKDSKIIDIGGGDSLLVDHLLDLGYKNISVLDISEVALERAKKRLGDRQHEVNWIVSNVTHFTPSESYDCWHDRAAFHFLTENKDIDTYKEIVTNNIKAGGSLIIGTFSEDGPEKCSGIPITQYTEITLENTFSQSFERKESIRIDHTTPFNTTQNFVFCRFNKLT